MYSTCLFCHAALGVNEAVEHFTIGRRLAFDAATGRLWVVCARCERWNLTPLEERWEAIEDCERLFRAAKLRLSTDQVGLARLREGTTLVRIGAPQRPELAAWRYGDQFGRRRRRYAVTAGSVVVAGAGLIAVGPVFGFTGGAIVNLYNVGSAIRGARPVVRLRFDDRPMLRLSRFALDWIELRPNSEYGYELEVPLARTWRERRETYGRGWWRRTNTEVLTITGADAVRAARVLLPAINVSGGRASTVRSALDLLEQMPRASEIFTRFSREQPRRRRLSWSAGRGRFLTSGEGGNLARLPAAQRLALEMVLHEDDERRALEGELAELEARWKEADEIAAISDDLLLPASILDKIRRSRSD
jgi:hypothetical protein